MSRRPEAKSNLFGAAQPGAGVSEALIGRLKHSERYQLTPPGRKVAVVFLKAHGRVLRPGFTLRDSAFPPDIAARSPLARARHPLDQTVNDFMDRQLRVLERTRC